MGLHGGRRPEIHFSQLRWSGLQKDLGSFVLVADVGEILRWNGLFTAHRSRRQSRLVREFFLFFDFRRRHEFTRLTEDAVQQPAVLTTFETFYRNESSGEKTIAATWFRWTVWCSSGWSQWSCRKRSATSSILLILLKKKKIDVNTLFFLST